MLFVTELSVTFEVKQSHVNEQLIEDMVTKHDESSAISMTGV